MTRNFTFVLGAGASRHAGAPLMKDFLDSAEDLAGEGRMGDVARDFELVQRGYRELERAPARVVLALDNIEALYTAFEMAELFGRLGTLEPTGVSGLTAALRRVITKTLEETIALAVSRDGHRNPTEDYLRFAKVVSKLVEAGHHVSILTFNYDAALDYALEYLSPGVTVNYAVSQAVRHRAGAPTVDLLKLHGSLTWATCGRCNTLVTRAPNDFLESIPHPHVVRDEERQVRFRFLSAFAGMKCSQPDCDGHFEPLIVPPTLSKSSFFSRVQKVWQAAAEQLAQADHVSVIGFSFPQTDEFFRYLYALGTLNGRRIRQFEVFARDSSVHHRFRSVLGPHVLDRYVETEGYFAEALTKLESLSRSVPLFVV